MLDNPLPFTPLKSLKPYKNAWRIQVKLLHVWRQYSVKAGESIEMILVDEARAHQEVLKVLNRGCLEDHYDNHSKSYKCDTRLACTLWGKYAEIVDQACQESTDGIVVCLIRFAKINLYNGNYIVMCYYISILF
ncbi:putative nucleic acid-binding protein [Arabidopsis thaliana]